KTQRTTSRLTPEEATIHRCIRQPPRSDKGERKELMQMTQLPRYTTRTTVRLRLQKKRLQVLLARPEFQALVESAPDALVMIDEQGRIALVNHQTEKLFGYSRQELLGQELECLLPERFRMLHLH